MSHDPILWIFTLTLMGLLPFVLLTLTCFARISMILIFVRQGLGIGNLPPNLVLNGVALLISANIMWPVFAQCAELAQPLLQREDATWAVEDISALGETLEPWRAFLELNSGDSERAAAQQIRAAEHDHDPLTLALAFVLTELQRALEAGVMILLPFLLIDIVVALVLLALGAHMLSPTSVTPALKILLFLSVEGWVLIAHGLGDGYVLP